MELFKHVKSEWKTEEEPKKKTAKSKIMSLKRQLVEEECRQHTVQAQQCVKRPRSDPRFLSDHYWPDDIGLPVCWF